MSISKKILVIADKEMTMEIYPKIIKKVNEWQRSLLDKQVKKNNYLNRMHFILDEKNKKAWSNGLYNTSTLDFKMFRFYYKIGGGCNDVSIFTCQVQDNEHLGVGNKIFFSLPNTENGEIVLNIIKDILLEYGKTFVFNIEEDEYYQV